MKAQYRIVGHDFRGSDKWVIIEDLNGQMSVTNDAEAVVKDLINLGYGTYHILYKDSMGHWDELIHNGQEFTDFGPGYTPSLV